MPTGTVSANGLNLRDAPNGTIVTTLPFGAALTIDQDLGEWLKVSAGARAGYVAARFVTRNTPAAAPSHTPAPIPPRDAGQIRSDERYAYTPAGDRFATRIGAGFMTPGETSIAGFVGAHAAGFAGVSASRLRVMQAVSANEGRLEAVNSYDNAFLSFGVFQWTAGVDDDPGELAALLARLRQRDVATFDEYFGSFGLHAEIQPGATAGRLALDGGALATAADKARLRGPEWAYRFWRAGHDDTVRQAQVEHAMARIDRFYGAAVAGATVREYVTSEYGVALLLDEHVNRPGHVPGTLAQAVGAFVQATGRNDPAQWGDADEAGLLEHYLAARARTTMTNSDARARAIADGGTASTARGSFQA